MYRSIYVPVDNSDHSKRAVELAIDLGKIFDSTMVASHVYAAKMHEYRFKQMEYSLPAKYLEEQELERQRHLHDSIITMGLKLISESYAQGMKKRCEEEGLDFESKIMDGKHHIELTKDIRASKYDLVIMGVLGLGRGRDSLIGSVCERVTREIDRDVWIVKHIPKPDEAESDTILVGIDGSPQSFGALMQAIALAKAFHKRIECVAVFDPYLHYSVFNRLAGVLSEEATKVFNFEEQNQLHEDIIDNGLAQIYQSHLNVAETMAAAQGMEVVKTLLDGKAFQKVLDHTAKTMPWVLALGRHGVHTLKGDTSLGSNTENLLRLCPCDIYLATGLAFPKVDVQARESIKWTEQAEERMTRVPDVVRGVARTAIVRLAIEEGHTVITSTLVGEAMNRYMPKQAGKSTVKLAQAMVFDRMQDTPISICRSCGVAASNPDPVKCGVCGSSDFELVTHEMFEKAAQSEGGIEEEKTYDGRSLKWSVDARDVVAGIEDEEQHRRVKTHIEKAARGNKIGVITLAFCGKIIEEETGIVLPAPKQLGSLIVKTPSKADVGSASLDSNFQWTDEAANRILRVPQGFMRNKSQGYVETLAKERGVREIDLALVEAGLEVGRKEMERMMGNFAPVAAPAGPDTPRDIESMNEVGLLTKTQRNREFGTQSPDTGKGDRESR